MTINDFYDEEDLKSQFRLYLEKLNKFRDGDCDANEEELCNIHKNILQLESTFDTITEIYDNHLNKRT